MTDPPLPVLGLGALQINDDAHDIPCSQKTVIFPALAQNRRVWFCRFGFVGWISAAQSDTRSSPALAPLFFKFAMPRIVGVECRIALRLSNLRNCKSMTMRMILPVFKNS
jgi:hypothetical protein